MWHIIFSSGFREWCVFGAEILVAWVIYLEVRHDRNVNFLEKATRGRENRDRRKIYNEFLKLPGELDEKARAFCEMIRKPENDRLRRRCERQIGLLNDLAFSCRKPWWAYCGLGDDPLVSLVPHASIYIWVILKPYIITRRNDTGPWYSLPFLHFTIRSIDLVLSHKRGLHFRSEGGGGDIEITREHLKQIREDVRRELNAKVS
jgi:hypothetical protein